MSWKAFIILPASLNVRSKMPLGHVDLLLKFTEHSSPRLSTPSGQPSTMMPLSASLFGRGFHGKSLAELQEHPNDSKYIVSNVCSLKNDLLTKNKYQCFFDKMMVITFILGILKKLLEGLRSDWHLHSQSSAQRLCSRSLGTWSSSYRNC